QIERITEKFPHLGRVYWFATTLDAAIHREWELSLGRRTALAKIAALFCEMRIRFDVVGMADGNSYALPLTQMDLAECLGLTAIVTKPATDGPRPEPSLLNPGLLACIATAALAGLLFGFDTAVISGTTESLRRQYGLSDLWLGVTVSSALWGTLVGALGAGI